ncbi:MAG: AAA family ATPase [Candidatus Peribacteria bacterium]|nr:AAA family ATPase [Candidatus Peribacteria bacterium]
MLNEKILFIDEIESNLHPHIIKNIFKIIHNDL